MKEEFALIPEHISQFTGLADIFVETGAGLGSGFTDEDYINLQVQKLYPQHMSSMIFLRLFAK